MLFSIMVFQQSVHACMSRKLDNEDIFGRCVHGKSPTRAVRFPPFPNIAAPSYPDTHILLGMPQLWNKLKAWTAGSHPPSTVGPLTVCTNLLTSQGLPTVSGEGSTNRASADKPSSAVDLKSPSENDRARLHLTSAISGYLKTGSAM